MNCIKYTLTIASSIEGNSRCLDKGSVSFHCLHIDYNCSLERTRNRQKYILEIINAYTKFVKFYPAVTTNSDEAIRHLRTYFRICSKPRKIVSDRGSAFTSDKFKEFLTENSIELISIATATPHANGQIERINRSLTPMLANLSTNSST